MGLMRGQRVVDAGVAPDIKRQHEIKSIFRKWYFMHACAKNPGSAIALARELDRMLALIDSSQLRLRELRPHCGEHATGAAPGVEERKGRMGRDN